MTDDARSQVSEASELLQLQQQASTNNLDGMKDFNEIKTLLEEDDRFVIGFQINLLALDLKRRKRNFSKMHLEQEIHFFLLSNFQLSS